MNCAAAGTGATGEAALACYRELLRRYHRTLDLMSDRGLAQLETKLEDAWAYAGAVARFGGRGGLLDVGTGAGLPGVVLAVALRERAVTWVERRRRRATFLGLVRAHCGLANVDVVAADVRSLQAQRLPEPLAVVTAQAVGDWAALYGSTRHLHGESVVFVARRGERWADEVSALGASISAEPAVLAAEPLGRGGTLVVLSVPGGCRCR